MPGVARGKKNANGEGSKTRRRKDGRYETRAVLNTPTGRRRVSFYGTTAKEANNEKIAALADHNRGVMFADPKGLKVAEYLQSWLSDTVRYQVSEGTFLRYERTCRNHLLPFFGRLRLRDLTPAHVRAFKARKLEEGLNPNTVGVVQSVLSAALNQAVDDGLISANPAARVKKAAARGQTPMRALSHEEATRLIRAAEGTRDEASIVVALRTGMRQGELAALRWEDEDRRGAQGGHRSPYGRSPQGAQGTAARGANGCPLVGRPRPRLPQRAGQGPPTRLRDALLEEPPKGGRSARPDTLPRS